MGRNVIMEEEFGLYGVEGNGEMKLFRNEVSMTFWLTLKMTLSLLLAPHQ